MKKSILLNIASVLALSCAIPSCTGSDKQKEKHTDNPPPAKDQPASIVEPDDVQAFNEAKQAIQKGEATKAKIYLLNAIRKAPEKLIYYQELYRNDSKLGISADELMPILEQGATCVPTKDVETMLQLINGIQAGLKNQKIITPEAKPDDAEESLAAAKAAMKLNQTDSARLHFLSAINKNPKKLLYYQELFKAAKSQSKIITLAELDNILRIGELNVKYCDVAAMESMRKELVPQNETQPQVDVSIDTEPLMNKLQKELAISTLACQIDYDKAIRLSQERMALLDELEANDRPDINYASERKQTSNVAMYFQIVASMNQVSANIDKILPTATEADLPLVNAMIQAANGLFVQAASLDYAALPAVCKQKMSSMAFKLKSSETEFNKKKSADALTKIINFSNIRDSYSDSLTQKIKRRQSALENISKELVHIYDGEIMKKTQVHIDDITKQIQKLSDERYVKYQEWAANLLHKTYIKYDDNGFVKNNEAVKYIEDISCIKLSLLSPEVTALYQDTLSQYLKQLDDELDLKIQTEKSMSIDIKKYTLEDF